MIKKSLAFIGWVIVWAVLFNALYITTNTTLFYFMTDDPAAFGSLISGFAVVAVMVMLMERNL